MCTVKVFIASDAMRRPGGRGSAPAGANRAGVRRKLFDAGLATPAGAGAPTSNFLRRIWEEIEKESEKKWNFDFKREAPLPGRYEWVPVGDAAGGSERPARTGDGTPVVREVRAVESPKAATQRKITEFMSQRKRARTPEAPSVSKVRRRSSEANEATVATT